VPLGTGSHEPCGNHLPLIESHFLIEGLAIDKATRALTAIATTDLMYNEPFRKAPGANSPNRLAGMIRIGRWGEKCGGAVTDGNGNYSLTAQQLCNNSSGSLYFKGPDTLS
jgi:hypothetical protein